MQIIKVYEGKLYVDNKETEISELTPEFLEQLFKSALEDEITFDIDDSSTIGSFFKDVENCTKEGSDFRNKYFDAKNKDISNSNIVEEDNR